MKIGWIVLFVALGIFVLGLFCLFIILLLNISRNGGRKRKFCNPKNATLVSAHYKENIEWVERLKLFFKIVVMEKECNGENCSPNLANEATSYLKYILSNYERLPPLMVFVHGDNQSWHHKGLLTDVLPSLAKIAAKKDYLSVNHFVIRDHQNYIDMPAFRHFYNDIFREYFGRIENYKTFCEERKDRKGAAQFFVKRETIHRLPKSFYQTYYDWLVHHSISSQDPEKAYSSWKTGAYAEHTWDFLFTGELKDGFSFDPSTNRTRF